METTQMVEPSPKNKNLVLTQIAGLGVSVAVLFGTVYLIGKAWKKSQK